MKEAIKYLKKAAEEFEKLEENRDNGVKYVEGKIDGLQQGREEGEAVAIDKVINYLERKKVGDYALIDDGDINKISNL